MCRGAYFTIRSVLKKTRHISKLKSKKKIVEVMFSVMQVTVGTREKDNELKVN